MPADSNQSRARQTLDTYIEHLHTGYTELLKILELQAADIAASDEIKLRIHAELEAEKVKSIVSLTRSVHTYSGKIRIDPQTAEKLRDIGGMKLRAGELSTRNIDSLGAELGKLKAKLESIKLPQSARRVYYSGNNPTLLDIKI